MSSTLGHAGPATSPARVRVKVNLGNRQGVGGKNPANASPAIPRSVQLLALAHHFQRLLDTGQAKDLADIARLGGISRARATQIANLAFLSPKIQEELISGGRVVGEHALRALAGLVTWDKQDKS